MSAREIGSERALDQLLIDASQRWKEWRRGWTRKQRALSDETRWKRESRSDEPGYQGEAKDGTLGIRMEGDGFKVCKGRYCCDAIAVFAKGAMF